MQYINPQYRTPKRRHSSLFHRMEEEILKISKKISAAKSSHRKSSYDKINSLAKEFKKFQRQSNFEPQFKLKENSFESKMRSKQNLYETTHFKNPRKNIHFDDFPQNSVVETVRIKKASEDKSQSSPVSGKRTMGSKTLNKRLNFASIRQNQQERILKLQMQNEQLSLQLKKLQAVCEDQSYRMGYASAYFDDKCKKLEQQHGQCQRQNIYLQKLCDHYKSKSKKYKEKIRKLSYRKVSESSSSYC